MIKLSPPFDIDVLFALAKAAHRGIGIEYQQTAHWLVGYHNSDSLRASIRHLWTMSILPLRRLADKITNVCAFYDDDQAEFGIMIETSDPGFPCVIQQAPLSKHYCKAQLGRLVSTVDPTLLDIFTSAPGLRLKPGPVLAVPDFLTRPLDTMAQVGCGPGYTVERSIHSDVRVITRDQCAMELIWSGSPTPEYGFIVLSQDLRVFVFFTDETIGVDECVWSCNALIEAFLEAPEEIMNRALHNLKPGGEIIHFFQAGHDARTAYDKLGTREKAVIVLRQALRLTRRLRNAEVRGRLLKLLVACIEAMIAGTPISADVIASLQATLDARKLRWPGSTSDQVMEAFTLVMYVNRAVAAWDTDAAPLYPDFRLGDMTCTPVYVSILNDIECLNKLRGLYCINTESELCQKLLACEL